MSNERSLLPKAGPRDQAAHANFSLSVASLADRQTIYRLRHDVYARELGQHPVNGASCLQDALDEHNVYLVVKVAGEMAGFVSLTPPGGPGFSIDKYFTRETLPFSVGPETYEIRLLTVLKEHRGREVAMLLMYAAFRWVEAHGGEQVVAIGRREILDLYLKVGLQPMGQSARCGAVTYDLLQARVSELRGRLQPFQALLTRLEERTAWGLTFSFHPPAPCFHGGAFFKAIGERFDTLERRETIINADVLDAWFPPSPRVLAALEAHLPWLLRTSPPTGCEGLIGAIAEARGVRAHNVLPGAGSSDLIFRALRHWLGQKSHCLILDPTYGEYAHVLERVVGCTVDRLPLSRKVHFDVDLELLRHSLSAGYDLVVLVNPNSPTGRHVPRRLLEPILRAAPARTRVWVDETYVEFAGAGESLEAFAAGSENVIVCKSLSKAYALSGARVAYLCAGAHQLEGLRSITPPWVVGLPAQVAATVALQDPGYYAACHAETHGLREELGRGLAALGWDVVPGTANFLLAHLPEDGPAAAEMVRQWRQRGLFVRDVASTAVEPDPRAVRIAVKDAPTNARMLAIIRQTSPCKTPPG